MSVGPVRFGIVGAGHMGERHAACIRMTPDARLTAVYSRTQEHATALARAHGARACPSLDELTHSPDVDAVIVATPTADHYKAALAALRAGKHAIVEKPLTRTLAQAETLAQCARDQGTLLLTGHVVRFFPAFRSLHDHVSSGKIGVPAVIRMSREVRAPATAWRDDLASSGGVILDLAIHEFDWLLWTIGPAARVFARGVCRNGGDAHTYALISLRFANGAIAHVESSVVRSTGPHVYGELAGDGGLVTYDSDLDTPLSFDLSAEDAMWEGLPTTYTEASPFVLQLQHWVRCIQGREQAAVPPEEACAALRVALAALQSAQTGQVVTL